MREIKFKAWDKDLKKWSDTPMKYAIEDINYYTDYVWCQYTGLKDENGNEIYNGDVLVDCEGMFKIEWSDEDYAYKVHCFMELSGFDELNIYDIDLDKSRKVGNINEKEEWLTW